MRLLLISNRSNYLYHHRCVNLRCIQESGKGASYCLGLSIAEAEDDLVEALALPGVKNGGLSVLKGWIEPIRQTR